MFNERRQRWRNRNVLPDAALDHHHQAWRGLPLP
jgi:hypothetical protein